ncbi:hypothetical protein OUZ56_030430 [Daphnia magna]|uniref:Secreted protein n=1 Tax=Daphnia magna TaxID=35525 RepID=A0ABQ9ZR94_9CRUS|nr:hypothetical protein OUZ56_030430 [Daphnia magna]
MAAYGVSPIVVLVLIFSIEIIFRSIHNWITKFLRYQTCLLSVADKNWRAPLSARQFPLQHPFLSATEKYYLIKHQHNFIKITKRVKQRCLLQPTIRLGSVHSGTCGRDRKVYASSIAQKPASVDVYT